MFELCRKRTVPRHGGPAVIENFRRPVAGIDHRFDGEEHAGLENDVVGFRFPVMKHARRGVEAAPQTVTAKITHDGKAFFFGDRLYGLADFTKAHARLDDLDTFHQRFIGDLIQALGFDGNIPGFVHTARVAEPAIENNCHVDIHDIAVHQFFRTRNTMTDNMVDRGADRFRITFVPKTGGDRVVLNNKIIAALIKFLGRHADFDERRNHVERLRRQSPGAAHSFEIRKRMKFNSILVKSILGGQVFHLTSFFVQPKFCIPYQYLIHYVFGNMTEQIPTAGLVIIGNEILSGRTQDTNTQWIAEKLTHHGVRLVEVRVIPDQKDIIIKTVNELRAKVGYLLTTGGIGPTHDDITAESIAEAFGVKNSLNPEARQALAAHYGSEVELTEPRLKMAHIPEGASLIRNIVSGAPGFIIGNVYVMAGVPRIMQAMLDEIMAMIQPGPRILSNTVTCRLGESAIAMELEAIQNRYPNVEIGSYPHYRSGILGLSLVLRGINGEDLDKATHEVINMIQDKGEEPGAVSLQFQSKSA